jgi:hypothetical protein
MPSKKTSSRKSAGQYMADQPVRRAAPYDGRTLSDMPHDEADFLSAGDDYFADENPERQARDAWAWDEEEYVVL